MAGTNLGGGKAHTCMCHMELECGHESQSGEPGMQSSWQNDDIFTTSCRLAICQRARGMMQGSNMDSPLHNVQQLLQGGCRGALQALASLLSEHLQ